MSTMQNKRSTPNRPPRTTRLNRGGQAVIMREAPTASRRYLPVSDPRTMFSKEWHNALSPSDFKCLYRLIQQEKVDVVIDDEDGALTLIADDPDIQAFIESVFESLRETAAYEARKSDREKADKAKSK